MINFHYKIDFLESQDLFIALVYGNSDLLATSEPYASEGNAIAWAEGFINGIKFARATR